MAAVNARVLFRIVYVIVEVTVDESLASLLVICTFTRLPSSAMPGPLVIAGQTATIHETYSHLCWTTSQIAQQSRHVWDALWQQTWRPYPAADIDSVEPDRTSGVRPHAP
jgi:hypothetical protein